MTALTGAAHLVGIAFTLRTIYKPSLVLPETIAAALGRLERREASERL